KGEEPPLRIARGKERERRQRVDAAGKARPQEQRERRAALREPTGGSRRDRGR
ncbi:MAG: hypothetical protein HYY04_12330, partial [Chloroflexi bacterium]|nr:hypothetical protein [Chloroflexota bacterium]